MKQQKKENTSGSGRRARNNRAVGKKNQVLAKKQRMNLIVGEPWTEPIEVKSDSSRKDGVNVLFAWAFLVLVFALTTHAWVKGDQATLKESLGIGKTGLAYVALWAGGKAALRVLSGWHDSDRKGQ